MKLVLVCVSVFVFYACGQKLSDSPSKMTANSAESDKDDSITTPLKDRSAVQPVEENNKYPIKPEFEMTPGQLCEHPSELRYPEKVKYCKRDVEPELKAQIFVNYDKEFGFRTRQMDRQLFKIDHLIPLCMGGGNDSDNLWPQYEDVYLLTDPLEPLLCQKMAEGRIKQAEAVRLIKEVKSNPNTSDAAISKIEIM